MSLSYLKSIMLLQLYQMHLKVIKVIILAFHDLSYFLMKKFLLIIKEIVWLL